jgi:DnaK suppressor protein
MAALTQQQTDALEQILRTRREALRDELEQSLRREGHSDLAENLDRVHDGGDDAMADVRADVNVAHVVAQYDELREIDSALQRMGAGDYGDCIDCGETIPFERLQTMPTATRCLACQDKFEQQGNRGRTDSTPSL